jgi:hypothetical protein
MYPRPESEEPIREVYPMMHWLALVAAIACCFPAVAVSQASSREGFLLILGGGRESCCAPRCARSGAWSESPRWPWRRAG